MAYRATGAVLPWNPSATGSGTDATAAVWALAQPDDGASVFAGGQFQNVGGQPAYGLAKIAATGTGALDATWHPRSATPGRTPASPAWSCRAATSTAPPGTSVRAATSRGLQVAIAVHGPRRRLGDRLPR